jgi:probable F420-dependent oxidoreductase
MQIGISINNMGPLSTKEVITRQALKAEQSGLDHIWVLDHIAIPPDQSEGSGGRYVDPLATLAFLSGITSTIKLGTSVLVLPYRPALATAKWVASIQELSSGRLILGVGVGWMEAEFIVTDASLKTRGSVTNETIEFFMECFANDIVSYKDQQFIFSPRPKRPPILIGGNQNAAIQRVMNYGDGWMPMIKDHDSLISECQDLQRRRREEGKDKAIIIPLLALDFSDLPKIVDQLSVLEEAGCTGIEHFQSSKTEYDFNSTVDYLAEIKSKL